ncbi:MAG: MFS transporter [Waddliaceae bacterium]
MRINYNTLIVILIGHFVVDFMLGIFPIYKTMTNIDVSLAGMIMGCGLIVGESAQLVIGYFSDRGFQKLFMASGVLLGGSLSLLSSTQHPFLLFLIVLSCYLGSAAFHPSASSMVCRLSSKSQGSLLSLFAAGGMIGAAVSQILFVQVMHFFNNSTVILILPALLVSFSIVMNVPIANTPKTEEKNFKRQFGILWKRRGSILPLYGMQIINQVLIVSIMFLMPDLFTEKGLPAGFSFGGAQLSLICGGIMFNLFNAKFNNLCNPRAMLGGLMITGMLILYTLIAVKLDLMLAVVLTVSLGAALTTLQPIILTEGNRAIPEESRGIINGLLLGGSSFFAGFGVMLSGILSKKYGVCQTMLSMGALSILFLIFNLFSQRDDKTTQIEDLEVAY